MGWIRLYTAVYVMGVNEGDTNSNNLHSMWELKVSSRIAMIRVAFLTSPPRHRVHVLPISVSLY